MEEEATQPATQIVIDPRRLGQGNSGLNDEDLADICCILHPSSIPAYKAAAEIHRTNPELTINSDSTVKIREKNNGPLHEDVDEFELDAEGLVSCDLVLRLSSNLKDPLGGFHFGRNKQRCDFVIGQFSETRRISNVHFRIYINEYGIIMLEDQSTNGTAVDGTLLRGKDKENGKDYRHTLDQGSMIVLTMTPPEVDYRFIVRIPQRDQAAENAYEQNLTAFYLRMNNVRMENEVRAAAAGGKREPVNLFPTPGTTTPNVTSMSSVGRSIREWKGGAKYNKVGCIGKGAFAVVYKITAKFDGVPYAAKELEKRRFMKNGILDQKVDMEMQIMRKIQHVRDPDLLTLISADNAKPNVVQYIEHVDWEEYLYIIMEYVPGGDLGSLINQHGHLPEVDVKLMAGQLLSALKYLHNMGITHRDVKPDNILIYSRNPFHVKLTDFGLSKMIDSEETFLRTFCGTLLYCAPEVYSEYREYDLSGRRNLRGVDKRSLPPQRYGHAVDIWSLAGVLFYALCGSPPYPVKNGTSYQELLNQIMTQPLDIRPLQRANIPDTGIRFVRRMLHVRPDYRATIEDLEHSSWLTGGDSLEVSMEDDEVDMIVDGIIDPDLEQETSQLSIRQPEDRQIENSEVFGDENISDITELQQAEIPSSFSTDESRSTGNGSFGFIPPAQNGNRNGRLFGEVNASDLGSSGAIPEDQLDLPVPTGIHRAYNSTQESKHTESEPGPSQVPAANATMPVIMAPPPPRSAVAAIRTKEADQQAVSPSSLMGAESMVGHLNMHSPASAASPNADSPAATTEEITDPVVSHRRPRDEFESFEADDPWRPADLPPKRRRKSEREIDMELPASVFWDPRDRSTHHYNYPRMSNNDFANYQEYAESKGEKFRPGEKTFETTMQSFRSSRSPSLEPEFAARAHSEPTKGEGRHMLMKRDERKLAVSANGHGNGFSSDRPTRDEFIPSTAHPSNGLNAGSPESGTNTTNSPQAGSQPVVGNDFQPPKRILGKVIAVPDSCLPTISLNLTEPITSWGRGINATVRYTNGSEGRIPKYAFKIFLFKPGFYDGERSHNGWSEEDQDMTFYVSTKGSIGIWVNDTKLCSHDPQNPSTESRNWGELRHGDHLTIWFNSLKRSEYTRFRFECFWGKSREPRKEEDEFKTLDDGPLLAEIERTCLGEESKILQEQSRREEEEKKMLQQEKERENLARQKPLNFTQSFSTTPHPAT